MQSLLRTSKPWLSFSFLGCLLACSCSSPDTHATQPETQASAAATPPPTGDPSTVQPVAFTASASASAEVPPASTASSANANAALPKMRVLVIGDSFAQALGNGLRSKEGETGIRFILRGEQATFIPEWAGPNKGVAGMMIQEKPDLVLIALGGNELSMVNPEVRGPKVKQLVGMLGSTPCVWITPPLWEDKKDNGLLGVIRKNSGPCRFYDSNTLSPNLPRGGDKIHPSAEGQKKWAGYLLDWLRKEREGEGATFSLKPRPSAE